VVSGTTYTWSTTFAAPAGGLAALLGSHTAYLGFTATTSVSDAIQQISGFTFTSYGAAPTMSGSAANGTVTLSWPVGSVVGTIVLQSSSNLASGIWTPVTPAPPVTVVNGNYQVSVPAGDGQQYFQLMLEP
jgi:hypothetical protein